jgi:alpha-methylacyl-CoA racemase
MEGTWLCKPLSSGHINVADDSSAALEPQFFAALLKGLSLKPTDLAGPREDRSTWPALRYIFSKTFLSKTRAEWELIFDGTDACCTPVLTQRELEGAGFDQRPIVTLRSTPGLAISKSASKEKNGNVKAAMGIGDGVDGEGWDTEGLAAGVGGEETLGEWVGWKKDEQYEVVDGGLLLKEMPKL